MILLQSNYEHQIKMISNILEAVKCGKVSEERINESVKRILSRKEKTQPGKYHLLIENIFKENGLSI